MAGGYMGKILNVDLANRKIVEEPLDEHLCLNFLGGYGIGARLLYSRMKPGVDPLGPDNILAFMTGPLTGTSALIGSRFQVMSKSPLTEVWGDANCGGQFGPHMKFAGIDGAFFIGASAEPVYLLVDEGMAELRDARHLWGKDCYETEDTIREELGSDVEVACIGPAGEQRSLIAAIITDKGRAAGRSGLGAVMGSKKLKAIAVKGNMNVPVADERRVKAIRREVLRRKGRWWADGTKYGTCAATAANALVGDSPVKNWTGVSAVDFPMEVAEKISDDAVIAYQVKRYGCWQCPIGCGGIVRLDRGKYALNKREGYLGHKPEYETLAMFGTLALNDNLESIIKINEICNRYGVDTISAGAVIAFAIECYENGLIEERDTNGLELTWGNHEAIVTMAERLAQRVGFGDVLADGVKVAADKIGRRAEEYAVHVHGQEVPAHDPKYLPGLATTYFADAAPARHTAFLSEEWVPDGWKEPVPDKYAYAGKGEHHKTMSCLLQLEQAAGLCIMANDAFVDYHEAVPEFLSAVTGWEFTLGDCLKIGERIANTRHAFNLREGENPLTWKVSGRLIGAPPLRGGNTEGITVDLKTQLEDFFEAMGWDAITGLPRAQRLVELGLEEIANDFALTG